MTFRDKRILVVGGAGFVGSNLILKLLEQIPREIIVVDNLLSSEACNIPDSPVVRFIFGDITDDRLLATLPRDLDYVWHLSCFHGNQSSIHDPIADHANNLLPSLKLFDVLKDFTNLKKVVYAAAGCAVAEKTYEDVRATQEDAPISLYHDSPYSISKIVGELYGNYYWGRYALPLVKARFQNVYGPREILGAGQWRGTPHTVWRNVIPTFIWKALHGEALPLDNGGNASRDFIFVEDMAVGLIKCAETGEPGEVYNLASGVETTILELAELINDITNNKQPPIIKPARDWDRSGRRFGSTEKAEKFLDFQARVVLTEGLKATVDWTQKNREMILACMANHSIHLKST